MEMIYIVIALALVQYQIFALLVGMARVRYKIDAPAVSGHPVYERYQRVHYNTMEQLVTFIPSILLFASYVHQLTATILGIAFLIGRTLYFTGYIKAPRKRAPGFGMTWLANIALLLGGLGGVIWTFI